MSVLGKNGLRNGYLFIITIVKNAIDHQVTELMMTQGMYVVQAFYIEIECLLVWKGYYAGSNTHVIGSCGISSFSGLAVPLYIVL